MDFIPEWCAGAAVGAGGALLTHLAPVLQICACVQRWGPGDTPHYPAFPAATGTDVAAVRAAILWERNQRLARRSTSAADAEGEAEAGAGRTGVGGPPGPRETLPTEAGTAGRGGSMPGLGPR